MPPWAAAGVMNFLRSSNAERNRLARIEAAMRRLEAQAKAEADDERQRRAEAEAERIRTGRCRRSGP